MKSVDRTSSAAEKRATLCRFGDLPSIASFWVSSVISLDLWLPLSQLCPSLPITAGSVAHCTGGFVFVERNRQSNLMAHVDPLLFTYVVVERGNFIIGRNCWRQRFFTSKVASQNKNKSCPTNLGFPQSTKFKIKIAVCNLRMNPTATRNLKCVTCTFQKLIKAGPL